MNTDYLEFKEYLEHAFTQADRAKEYEARGKKEANLRERDWKDTVRATAIKLIDAYLEANNTTGNTYVGNTGANYYTTHGGNQTAVTELNKANTNAKKKEEIALNNLLSFIQKYPKAFNNSSEERYIKWLSDKKTFNKQEYAKDLKESLQTIHYSWRRSSASHSSLEHASRAGMPTNIPKQQTKSGRGGMPSNVRNNAINKALQAVSSASSALSSYTEKENNLHDSYISATFAKSKKPWQEADMNELGPKTRNAATTELTKIRSSNDRKLASAMSNARSALNSLLASGVLTDSEKNSILRILAVNDKAVTSNTLSTYYLPDLEATLKNIVKHDSLEHGWFSDLFKKTTNAKGSTAGMPSNIPVNHGGSAVAAMNSYTDQLARLTNSLYQYELLMKQYKEAYDQAKNTYANTKKEISRIEKLREEAIKNAKYPITDTTVSKLKENKDATYRHLAGKTTGSTAGMPSNLRRR